MKRRARDTRSSATPAAAPFTVPTRRQFLSTIVAGAAYTACGERPGAPRPGAVIDAGGAKPPGSKPGSAPPDARREDPASPPVAPGNPGPTDPGADARAPMESPDAAAETGARRKTAADRVVLGKTGIVVSRLAMGSGTHGSGGSSAQTRLGVAGFARLLVEGYNEQGLNFWESADQYGSHPHLKEAMRQVGRDKVVVLTKTHARTAAEMQADLDRYRRELGTDMIDILLLHNRQSGNWTQECAGAMEVLARAKEQGIIRAHGVSCHTLQALRLAARTPWVDVDLARINPARIEMDADPATVIGVLREMKAAGKGVIGMKILGVGALANRLDMAIQHAVQLDALDAFTIGFTNRPHLDAVATKIAATPV